MNAVVSRRRAGRSATLVGAKPTLADRAVNPQLPPPCGFVDGAKRRRPQLHRANNRKTRLQLLLFNPLKSQKRLNFDVLFCGGMRCDLRSLPLVSIW